MIKLLYTWAFFLLATLSVIAQNIEVTGTIKDEKGEPIIGAVVLVKGTQRGTSADMDGNYTIQAKVGETLSFSTLGMQTVERKVTATTKQLNIVLKEDVEELEELVVTGYGAPKIARVVL
ncbi:hypothetical protein RCZ04_07620 [Capnocytophaga sp. HP1101]